MLPATAMGKTISAVDGMLRPLLLCCYPEFGPFRLPETLDGGPGLLSWEIALSASVVDRGWVRSLGRQWPIHTPSDADKLLTRLPAFDLIVVAPLSLNTLAKFALGLRDSAPSALLAEAAAQSLPIFLDDTLPTTLDSGMNPHLLKIYRRYWDGVRGGTIMEFTPPDLTTAVLRLQRNRRNLERSVTGSAGKQVLTRDDVLAAHAAMQPLLVPSGALITDLAREEAAKLGVPLHLA